MNSKYGNWSNGSFNVRLDEEALYLLWDIPEVRIWIRIDVIDCFVVIEEVSFIFILA